jgi:dTMP kinase
MKLITFEGIEGVGKSTQINLIHDWLLSLNYTVKLLREPGSTAFGEEIRNLLLSNDSDINYYTELLLMFAARKQMITEHFVNAKEDFILCDRYYHASIAYQGYGRKLPLNFIDSLVDGLACPKPDLTIIYDLDVKLGFLRKSKDIIDRIESSGNAFFEDVRAGYIEMSKTHDEVNIINADNSFKNIHKQSKNLIKKLI